MLTVILLIVAIVVVFLIGVAVVASFFHPDAGFFEAFFSFYALEAIGKVLGILILALLEALRNR
jgi:hypothetical protein